MSRDNALDAVGGINRRLNALALLDLLDCGAGDAGEAGGMVMTRCPLHGTSGDNLALEVDVGRNSFKCAAAGCPGVIGGTLVELVAWTRGTGTVAAAADLAEELALELDASERVALGTALAGEAQAALSSGDEAAAEAAAVRALRLDADSGSARTVLAEILSQRGETTAACEEFLAAADSLATGGDLEQANLLLKRAQEICPGVEDILLARARIAELRGKPEKAAELLEEVATAREQMGRGADNLGLLKRVTELCPNDANVHLRLAALHEGRRDMRSSVRALEKAADLLSAQGRGSEAIPLIEKILTVEPQRNRMRLALAERMADAGEYEQAKEYLFEAVGQQVENSEFVAAAQSVRRWMEIEPDSVEAREWLSRIYQEQEMSAEAGGELRQAARICRDNGDIERALQFYFRAKFVQPDDEALREEIVSTLLSRGEGERAVFELMDMAEAYFSRGAAAEGEAILNRAAETDSSAPSRIQVAAALRIHDRALMARDLLNATAGQLEESGNLAGAIQCWEAVAEAEPSDMDSRHKRLELLWRAGEVVQAVNQAAELAQLHVEEGDEEQGVALVADCAVHLSKCSRDELRGISAKRIAVMVELCAHESARDSAAALYAHSCGALRAGPPATAFRCAETMLRILPGHEPALREMADLGELAGHGDRAADALVELADAAERRDESENAAGFLERAAQLAPSRPALLRRRAELLERVGDAGGAPQAWSDYLTRTQEVMTPVEALAEYTIYVAAHPQDGAAGRGRAQLLALTGNPEEARAAYTSLLEQSLAKDDAGELVAIREGLLALEPANAERRVELGEALIKSGDLSRAVEELVAAGEALLSGSAWDRAAEVAARILDLVEDSSDALKILVQAERRRGGQGALEEGLSRLESVLVRLGRSAEAMEALDELSLLRPDDAKPRVRAAEILEGSGDSEGALVRWLEAARLHEAANESAAALAIYARISPRITDNGEALAAWSELAARGGQAGEREQSSVALADHHIARGAWGEARGVLKRLGTAAPDVRELAPATRRLAEAQGGAPGAVQDWLAAAELFALAGEVASAGACLNRAVDADPSNPATLERLAAFYTEQEDHAAAFRVRVALLRARLIPGIAGKWGEELATLRQWKDLQPAGRLTIARVLMEAGERTEALPELELVARDAVAASDYALALEACDLDPRVAVLSGVLREVKAGALEALGRKDAAAAWLRECAEAALREERPDEAENYTRRWSALAPGDPGPLGVMTGIHLQRRKPQLAFETSLAQANFLWARGHFDAAAETLRRAIELVPDSVDARRHLWQVELNAGRPAKALVEMQVLVGLLLRRGDEREAYEVLREVLRLDPHAVEPLRSMAGLIYRHRGFPKALPAYRRLLSTLRDQGLADEAVREYQSILDLEDAPVELRLEYADYIDLLGHHRESKRQYLQAARHVRDVLGDYGQAARLLGMAAAPPLEPEDADALEELAILRRIARMEGQAAQGFREASRLHEARGYAERALECLQQALEVIPGTIRPLDLVDLSRLLLALGKKRDAIDACRRAIDAAHRQEEDGDDTLSGEQILAMHQRLYELEPLDAENALALIELLPVDEAADFALKIGHELQSAELIGEYVRVINAALERLPENLSIRAEAVAVLRRQDASEPLRHALADLCRTAARLGDEQVARAALEQLASMPSSKGSALLAAPLFALCGEATRAVQAYCGAAREMLDDDDAEGAAMALEPALTIDSDGVPGALVAALVRQGGGSAAARSVALRMFDDALVRKLRARSVVLGTALLETLPRPEAAVLVRHMVERGGASLASLIVAVQADWLLARNEALQAGSLVRQLTGAAPSSPEAWKLASRVLERIAEGEAANAANARAEALLEAADPLSGSEDEGELTETDELELDDKAVLETLASFYQHEHRMSDAVRALRRLASLSTKSGEAATAAECLKRALAISPGEPGLREDLAERLIEAQRPQEAADHFRELAQFHIRRADTESARTAAEHVLDLDPRDERMAEFLLQLARAAGDAAAIVSQTVVVARAHIASGVPEQAYQLLMETLEGFPNHPDLLRALAACSKDVTSAGFRTGGALSIEGGSAETANAGTLKSPIAQFEMLLSLQPDDLDVLEILANTCAAEGYQEKHARYAEQLVRQASAGGDLDRALEAGQVALHRTPDLASIHRALGDVLHAHGRTAEAVPEWMKAAGILAREGMPEGAAEAVQLVTRFEPDNTLAWKVLAEYLSAAGDTEGARHALEKVTESFRTPSAIRYADTTIRRLKGLETGDPISHERAYALERRAGRKGSAMEELVWLVRYHLEQGNTDAAEKMICEGEELDRDSLSLLECKAELEGLRGNAEAQRETLKILIRRAGAIGDHPRAEEALARLREMAAGVIGAAERIELGELMLSTGDRENAYLEFSAAVKGELGQGDPAAARGTAEAILKRHPGVAELYAAMAEPFVTAGRADIASGYFAAAATLAASVGDAAARERYLREALAVRPRWTEGLLQLAESCVVTGDRGGAMEAFARLEGVLLEEGQFDRAADAVRRQITLHPKDAALRERLADYYEQAGDRQRTGEALEDLAELRQRRGDIRGAIAAFRKLVSLRPGDSAVLQRYAEILNRLGDGPEVVEAYLRLADVYYNRGANVQAAEIYARVLGIAPDNEEARKRLLKLQE